MVIESPPELGEKQKRRSLVKLGIKLEIIPTPPRSLPTVPVFFEPGQGLLFLYIISSTAVLLAVVSHNVAYVDGSGSSVLHSCGSCSQSNWATLATAHGVRI